MIRWLKEFLGFYEPLSEDEKSEFIERIKREINPGGLIEVNEKEMRWTRTLEFSARLKE